MAWEGYHDCPYLRLWENYELTTEELHEYCEECPFKHRCPFRV